VRRRAELRRPGLRVRGRTTLAETDTLKQDGIPVTSPILTLIDLATELRPLGIERAVNEADKRDLVDPETLRLALDAYAGQPGVPTLRKLLDKLTFRLSDSDLEILFRPVAAAAGLPPPLTKQIVRSNTSPPASEPSSAEPQPCCASAHPILTTPEVGQCRMGPGD